MQEFYLSLASGTISGLVTGLVVGVFLYFYQKRDQENEKVNINLEKLKRRLPQDILKFIVPGISLDKAKEFLGVPDNISFEGEEFRFKESPHSKTNSYLFKFLNASLKLTSLDNIMVDTVTIFSNPLSEKEKNNKIRVFPNPYESHGKAILGKTKLTSSFIQENSAHFSNRSSREIIFGIDNYYGRFGNYMNYSYFGYHAPDIEKYEKTNDPKFLIGGVIDGFCISRISGFAPYISIHE